MGKLIQNIKDFFRYLFKPSFWMLRYKYNCHWDMVVNELIDKNLLYGGSFYTCKIKHTNSEIWVGSYPFNYGSPYIDCKGYPSRPSRRTMERLCKHIGIFPDPDKEYITTYLKALKPQLEVIK